jgi:hypothetical protein
MIKSNPKLLLAETLFINAVMVIQSSWWYKSHQYGQEAPLR